MQTNRYVTPYLVILERNQLDIQDRLDEYVEMHEVFLANLDGYDVLTQDQKYSHLNEMYVKATDTENADKAEDLKMVHPEMLGRIMN